MLFLLWLFDLTKKGKEGAEEKTVSNIHTVRGNAWVKDKDGTGGELFDDTREK